MSLDEIRDDLKRNLAEAKLLMPSGGNPTVPASIAVHLCETLWPFLESLVDTVDEIDDAVAELVDQQEDYLQPETAAVFAAVVQSSLQIIARIKPMVPRDQTEFLQQLADHEQLCAQAVEVLGAVTMIEVDGDDEEGDAEAEQTEEQSDE